MEHAIDATFQLVGYLMIGIEHEEPLVLNRELGQRVSDLARVIDKGMMVHVMR
jgi:hypothetical protein